MCTSLNTCTINGVIHRGTNKVCYNNMAKGGQIIPPLKIIMNLKQKIKKEVWEKLERELGMRSFLSDFYFNKLMKIIKDNTWLK